jgi:hypothetical protein
MIYPRARDGLNGTNGTRRWLCDGVGRPDSRGLRSSGGRNTWLRGGLLALSTLRSARFEPGGSVLVTAAAGGTGHLAGCYWWAWRQKSSCQAGVPGLVTPTWVSRMATVSVAGTMCAAVPVPPVHP